MNAVVAFVNQRSVKDFVTDVLVGCAAALASLNLAPQSFRDLIDAGSAIVFVIFVATLKAGYKSILKWATT
jgi:hypothetical protein